MVCFKCGRYGHKATQCVSRSIIKGQEGSEASQGKTNLSIHKYGLVRDEQFHPLNAIMDESKESNPSFGPWMVVTRRRRKQPPNKKASSAKEGDKKQEEEGVFQSNGKQT